MILFLPRPSPQCCPKGLPSEEGIFCRSFSREVSLLPAANSDDCFSYSHKKSFAVKAYLLHTAFHVFINAAKSFFAFIMAVLPNGQRRFMSFCKAAKERFMFLSIFLHILREFPEEDRARSNRRSRSPSIFRRFPWNRTRFLCPAPLPGVLAWSAAIPLFGFRFFWVWASVFGPGGRALGLWGGGRCVQRSPPDFRCPIFSCASSAFNSLFFSLSSSSMRPFNSAFHRQRRLFISSENRSFKGSHRYASFGKIAYRI